MNFLSAVLVAFSLLLSHSFASPTPSGTKASPKGASSGLNVRDGILASVVSGVVADASDAAHIFSADLGAFEDTVKAQVTGAPTSIPEVVSLVSSVFASTPTNLFDDVLELIEAGIAPTPQELETLIVGSVAPENSEHNVNLKNPNNKIYPFKSTGDAPYTLSEAQLREVIYIPQTFTYGKKPPVIVGLVCKVRHTSTHKIYLACPRLR